MVPFGYLEDRPHQDPEVEADVPVLYVPVVELDAGIQGRVASETVGLGPPRHSRFDPVTVLIPR